MKEGEVTVTKARVAKKQSLIATQIPVRQEQPVTVQTPDMMLAVAVSKGMDLAYIEKLMDLQKRWEEDKAKKAFNIAFAKFQSIVPELKKNKKTSFKHKDGEGKTEYSFHQLGDIAMHIRQPLADCGLSYSWTQREENGVISVKCILSHIEGYERVSEPLSGAADNSGSKNIIQQKASTISYLRRYTLTGILGLSSSDMDNDGAGGAKPKEDGHVDLPLLNDGQFANLTKKVVLEKWTMEQVEAKCTLSPDQRAAIETIIKSRV